MENIFMIKESYMRTHINRVGEKRIMNCGYEAEIIEFNNADDMTIKFIKTEEIIKTNYGNFKKGGVKSHFTPTVYGWGIIGTEDTIDKNGNALKPYRVWSSMIGRCYGEVYNKNNPNYIGCEVCEEWRYYSNFKKWFYENYYELEDEDVQLDKDLICKNKGLENKLYSPNTCLFLPKGINTKLRCIDRNSNFSILPCGHYRIGAKIKGFKQTFETYEEALKGHKLDRLMDLWCALDKYDGKIPENVFNEIYNIKI